MCFMLIADYVIQFCSATALPAIDPMPVIATATSLHLPDATPNSLVAAMDLDDFFSYQGPAALVAQSALPVLEPTAQPSHGARSLFAFRNLPHSALAESSDNGPLLGKRPLAVPSTETPEGRGKTQKVEQGVPLIAPPIPRSPAPSVADSESKQRLPMTLEQRVASDDRTLVTTEILRLHFARTTSKDRCMGPQSVNRCTVCDLVKRSPVGHFRKLSSLAFCVCKRLCFTCLGEHLQSKCSVGGLVLRDVCVKCGLRGGSAHTTKDKEPAKNFGAQCNSWARDNLMEVCLYAFYDSSVMNQVQCPAHHVRGSMASFRGWLYSSASNGVPNNVLFCEWVLARQYHLLSTSRCW
jgi:hypothetical protein